LRVEGWGLGFGVWGLGFGGLSVTYVCARTHAHALALTHTQARVALGALEMRQCPASAGKEAASEECARAQHDLTALRSTLRTFLPQPDSGDGAGVGQVGKKEADGEVAAGEMLLAARKQVEILAAAAGAAADRVAAEVEREASAACVREEAIAAARRRLAEATAGVEESLRTVEEVEVLERRLEEVRERLKAHQDAPNPWERDVLSRQAGVDENRLRLQQVREQLAGADREVELWGSVDELLGKRGLQNFVYEVAVLELQRRAAKYLEILSEDSLRLQLSLNAQVVERHLLVRLTDGRCELTNYHALGFRV
jgi:DNA repair exonuclease SbcCD ATPase subunit